LGSEQEEWERESEAEQRGGELGVRVDGRVRSESRKLAKVSLVLASWEKRGREGLVWWWRKGGVLREDEVKETSSFLLIVVEEKEIPNWRKLIWGFVFGEGEMKG
jgi:hypothetical protein